MKKFFVIFLIVNLTLLSIFNTYAYAAITQESLSSAEQLKGLAVKNKQQRSVRGVLGLICGAALVSWGFGNLNGMAEKNYYSFGGVIFDVFVSPLVAALGSVMGYQGIEAIFMPSQAEKDYDEMIYLDDCERETYAAKVLAQYGKDKDKKNDTLNEAKEINKPLNYDELRFENQQAIDRKTQEYLKRKFLPMFDDKKPLRDANW